MVPDCDRLDKDFVGVAVVVNVEFFDGKDVSAESKLEALTSFKPGKKYIVVCCCRQNNIRVCDEHLFKSTLVGWWVDSDLGGAVWLKTIFPLKDCHVHSNSFHILSKKNIFLSKTISRFDIFMNGFNWSTLNRFWNEVFWDFHSGGLYRNHVTLKFKHMF